MSYGAPLTMGSDEGHWVKVGNERIAKMKGEGGRAPVTNAESGQGHEGWWQVLAQYPDKGFITIQARDQAGKALSYTILKSDVIQSKKGSPKLGVMENFPLRGGARRRRRATRRARKSRRHTRRR